MAGGQVGSWARTILKRSDPARASDLKLTVRIAAQIGVALFRIVGV